MSRLVAVLLPLACLAYAAVALGTRRAWVSAAAAVLVAWLLWRRHSRARFAAYIIFSVMAVRGVMTERWAVLAFAVAAVLVLQTPAARAAWPRLTPRWRRDADGRMRGP